jgi:hypothetical protein
MLCTSNLANKTLLSMHLRREAKFSYRQFGHIFPVQEKYLDQNARLIGSGTAALTREYACGWCLSDPSSNIASIEYSCTSFGDSASSSSGQEPDRAPGAGGEPAAT